jgi:DNA-binding MarR family transcriptional regulator
LTQAEEVQDYVAYDPLDLLDELGARWPTTLLFLYRVPEQSADVRRISRELKRGPRSVERTLEAFARLGVADRLTSGGRLGSHAYRLTARGRRLIETPLVDWSTIVVK